MQIDEVRVGGVQGVGVGAVGGQHQGAVLAGEGAGGDRAGGYPVGALHVVGQHIARQGQLVLGGSHRVGVAFSPGHIVYDGDIQRAAGHITIGVADQYREAFAQPIGTVASGMGLGTGEGVAVADDASGSIVAGDGQDIAEPGGDGLPHAGHRARSHHIDTTDIKVEHPVWRYHGEAAGLGQGGRVTGRALRQVGLVQAQLATVHRQPFEADRVVCSRLRGRHQHWRRFIVIEQTDIQVGQLWKSVEARRRKADDRIDPSGHFTEQYKGVTATRCSRRPATAWASGGRIGFLARVDTGSNRLLELLYIGELRLARRRRLRGVHVRCAVGQQRVRQLQAAATPQGQLAAILQMDGHGARNACIQLLAYKQPVTFSQRPTCPVTGHSEDFSDNFADDTD
ncbi:hypothetical protein D3C77_292130 [compost metagenome]